MMNALKGSILVIAVILICGIVLVSCQRPETVVRPNVIFILTDDQGYGDMGVAGHPYMMTPNIDRLAKEGTRFTQFYVNATVCAPSRVALMTGQFPARNNVHHIYLNEEFDREHGVPVFLDPELLTVADVMKQAGYTTGHIGKWHLEGRDLSSPPDRYGFDSWLVTHDASQSPVYRDRFSSTVHKITQSSHWIMEDGIEFIKNHKDDGQPFYLNLWTLVPHGLLSPSQEELAIYNDLKTKPEDFNSWMYQYANSAADLNEQMKVYCASMTSLDEAIGILLNYLDETGLTENTLIFYASDNGPEDYHIGDATNAGVGSPGILRGRKRSIYEGGVRVPCIVRWPGHVPAGKISDVVWSGVDWLPTLAGITGITLPAEYQTDGEDVSDVFFGSKLEHHESLFWEWKYEVAGNNSYHPPQLAIRKGDWKFLCNPDGSRSELYNLKNDPGEYQNLAMQKPEIVDELKSKLLDWKRSIPETAYANDDQQILVWEGSPESL
jgi:N-acetylgalactosamine-6-sulfatase